MKGLLRDHFYAVRANMALFSVFMLLLGVFVVLAENRASFLVIGYMLLGMVGFPFLGLAGLGRKNSGRWSQYKLTAPVRRSDIIRSSFAGQLLWLLAGMTFAGGCAALAALLHGFPLDRDLDVFLLYVVGIGVSLFMGAVFFPLFYWGGEERGEVLLLLSLLCGVGIMAGLITALNLLFGPQMTAVQMITSGLVILLCSLLAFLLSCPLTVRLFQRRDF